MKKQIHPDLVKILTPTTYTPDEQKVRDWYKKNAHVFLEELVDPWTPLEAAALAVELKVGDAETVYRIGVHYYDATTGTHTEKRAIQEVFKETLYLEDTQKIGDQREREIYLSNRFLMPLWKNINAYLITGGEFYDGGE
jgi:hypothetical protein